MNGRLDPGINNGEHFDVSYYERNIPTRKVSHGIDACGMLLFPSREHLPYEQSQHLRRDSIPLLGAAGNRQQNDGERLFLWRQALFGIEIRKRFHFRPITRISGLSIPYFAWGAKVSFPGFPRRPR